MKWAYRIAVLVLVLWAAWNCHQGIAELKKISDTVNTLRGEVPLSGL